MPQIKEYVNQVEPAGPQGGPQASPEQFGAGVGRSVEQLGATVGQIGSIIQKNQERAEVSDLNAEMADKHSQWTIEYQKQLQDGTLDTGKFMEAFSDDMDKVGENYTSTAAQQHFNQTSAQLKGHFLETASAGQAQLAGEKAKTDYTKVLDKTSSSLINDPSSFDTVKQLHDQTVDNLVEFNGLPARHAEELKTKGDAELAKSAVRGWIQLNPDEAKAQLSSGKWDDYFSGDVKKQLYGEVDQAVRGRAAEEMRLQKQKEVILQQQQTATQNDFLQKLEQNQLSSKDILNSNLDPFGSGSKEQFLKLMENHSRERAEKIKTDPDTFIRLWDQIHAADDSPNKILDENQLNQYMGRGLTVTDINALRAEIQGKKTAEGNIESELKKGLVDIAKGKLTRSNPLIGLKDPEGDTQVQKYLSWMLPEYNAQRKAGKSPRQLTTPGSPDYLGDAVTQFARSPKQVMKDLIKMNTNQTPNKAAEPRQENESASDYLKRTGK